MAYEYDRVERENGGGAFLMGMLAGTVLGAGLGMLFAPKAGVRSAEAVVRAGEPAALDRERHHSAGVGEIQPGSQQAGPRKIGQASEKVSQIVDRGREAYDRAKAPTAASRRPTAGYPTSAPTDRS